VNEKAILTTLLHSSPVKCVAYVVVALVMLVAGCGEDRRVERSQPPEITTERVSLEPPAKHYFIADSDCQAGSSEHQFTRLPTYQLGARGLTPVEVDVPGLISQKSLSSQSVAHTIFGRVYERRCDQNTPQGRQCLDKYGTPLAWTYSDADTRYLRVCSDRRFDRDSYEGIAQASIAAIEKARNSIMRATNLALVPEPVTLEILPTYRSIYAGYPSPSAANRRIDYVKYITNNLFYSPSSKMISVYPETDDTYQRLLTGAVPSHLWESPFVLAHEFGHHVEASIAAASNAVLAVEWSPITHQYELLSLTTGTNDDLAYLRLMLGALSEAFADLVGYYSEQGETAAINRLPTLAVDRDPTSSRYGDGSDKIFSDALVNLLKDPRFEGERSPHRVGAIFAYAIARQFQIVTAAGQGAFVDNRSPHDRQLFYLIHWFRKFRTDLSNATANQQILTVDQVHLVIAESMAETLRTMLNDVATSQRERVQTDLISFHDAVLSGLNQRLF
jgi:hypothetical protein